MGERRKLKVHNVDGLMYSDGFFDVNIKSGLRYKARPDDIFISTFPKCGTTWVQQLSFLIMNDGQPPKDWKEFNDKTPFLELTGSEVAENMPRPGMIKVHQYYDRTPYHPEAKYVYVLRNPFDCCVSYFHHTKMFPEYGFEDGTFSEFLSVFLAGKSECEFGDYFDHVLSWWQHRNNPKILFLFYEQLRSNTGENVKKLVKFLGDEYAKKMDEDKEYLENVLKYSSFDYMKINTNKQMEEYLKEAVKNPDPNIGWSATLIPKKMDFVRKGAVKGYKKYFTEDELSAMKKKYHEKFDGTGLIEIWSKYVV